MKQDNIHKLANVVNNISTDGSRTLNEIHNELFKALDDLGIKKWFNDKDNNRIFNPSWTIAHDMLAKNIEMGTTICSIRGKIEENETIVNEE